MCKQLGCLVGEASPSHLVTKTWGWTHFTSGFGSVVDLLPVGDLCIEKKSWIELWSWMVSQCI